MSEYFVNDKHISTKTKFKWLPKVPRSLSQQIELRQHLKSKFLSKTEIVYMWLATGKMAASMCAICKQNSQIKIAELQKPAKYINSRTLLSLLSPTKCPFSQILHKGFSFQNKLPEVFTPSPHPPTPPTWDSAMFKT